MSEEYDDFAQELEQFLDFDSPSEGDLRTGTIVSISPQGIIVALDNLKRDGIVPHHDLNKLGEEEREALKVDDQVTVKVMSGNDPDTLTVSIYEARIVEDWADVNKLRESQDVIEVEVIGYNKGGLIAPYGRLRGFIPLSQVSGFSRGLNDRDRQRKMAKMRGEKLPVKVIEVDQERKRLVFSEREGVKESREAERQKFFEELKPGDVLNGTVRSMRDFGVFVDLGPADGLVHVSELAWYRIDHPKEVVKIGDKVDVQVLKVNAADQRISLTRKPLIVNPWTVIHETYSEQQLVEGRVVRLVEYGAFVELEPGVEGLLHITQLSRTPVRSVDEYVREDEEHLLRVLSIDSDRQRIRLSLKSVTANEQIEWMTRKQQEAEAAALAAVAKSESKADESATEESGETTEAEEVVAEVETVAEGASDATETAEINPESEPVEEVVASADVTEAVEEVSEVETVVESVEEEAAEVVDAVESAETEVEDAVETAVEEVTPDAVEEVVEDAAEEVADVVTDEA